MTTETTTPETNDTTADVTAVTTALGDAATAEAAAATTDEAADVADADDTADAPANTDDEPTGAPETYDTAAFVMPEGVEFDADGFAAVEPVLRDLNLTNDQAGKLMSAYAEKIVPMIEGRVQKAQDDAAAELSANLARDLQADPEVGGKNLKESQAFAAKAIAKFIPDATARSEFSTFLNESGLGNHPLLARVLAGAGRAVSEATTPAGEGASQGLTTSEKFYGRKG